MLLSKNIISYLRMDPAGYLSHTGLR